MCNAGEPIKRKRSLVGFVDGRPEQMAIVTGTRLDDAIADLGVIAGIATPEQIDEIANFIAVWREEIEHRKASKGE